MPDRSALRKARYAEARRLGFSSAEARKLRDISGENTKRYIAERREEIEEIPQRRRTREQRSQLRILRRTESMPEVDRFASRPERIRNYSEWSARREFPDNVQRLIHEYNSERGLPLNDGYGYRLFYHRYVNQWTISRATRWIETHDT